MTEPELLYKLDELDNKLHDLDTKLTHKLEQLVDLMLLGFFCLGLALKVVESWWAIVAWSLFLSSARFILRWIWFKSCKSRD